MTRAFPWRRDTASGVLSQKREALFDASHSPSSRGDRATPSIQSPAPECHPAGSLSRRAVGPGRSRGTCDCTDLRPQPTICAALGLPVSRLRFGGSRSEATAGSARQISSRGGTGTVRMDCRQVWNTKSRGPSGFIAFLSRSRTSSQPFCRLPASLWAGVEQTASPASVRSCRAVVHHRPPCRSTKPRNSHYPNSDWDSSARQPEATARGPPWRHKGKKLLREQAYAGCTLPGDKSQEGLRSSNLSSNEIDSPSHRLPMLEYRSL
jgi:hypothetical protein